MLKPDKDQIRAIAGMCLASPAFSEAYCKYLIDSRDHERRELEGCPASESEQRKGRCQILSEQITLLKSLVPQLSGVSSSK